MNTPEVEITAVRTVDYGIRIAFTRKDLEGELRFDYDRSVPSIADISVEADLEDVLGAVAYLALVGSGERGTVPFLSGTRLQSALVPREDRLPESSDRVPSLCILVAYDFSPAAAALTALLLRQKHPFGVYHLVPQGGGDWSGRWSQESIKAWSQVKDSCGPVAFECRSNLPRIGVGSGYAIGAAGLLPLTVYGGGWLAVPGLADDFWQANPDDPPPGMVYDLPQRVARAVWTSVVSGLPGLSEAAAWRLAEREDLPVSLCERGLPRCGVCAGCIRERFLADAWGLAGPELLDPDWDVVLGDRGVPDRPHTWAFIAGNSKAFKRQGGRWRERITRMFRGVQTDYLKVYHQGMFDKYLRLLCPVLEEQTNEAARSCGLVFAGRKHQKQLELFKTAYRKASGS